MYSRDHHLHFVGRLLATITLNRIQHGWRPPSWESLTRHNSAADDPISMKFGKPMENHRPMTVKRSKSKSEVEFQYGGRLFLETSNISAVDWDIWSKLSIALALLKCETWPNQKSEVDLRRYGHHFVKSIWRHNSVGDYPIWTKFGRLMQNRMPTTLKRSYGNRK